MGKWTHSKDCYKWHHECAIARLERITEMARKFIANPKLSARDDLQDALNTMPDPVYPPKDAA